ncbi:hypothetical protein AMECASPLE_013285 [Ameca splendens]|uniref:Uncharacterized protein n=1 Tax=Ameca splendens TaxID=208324 RepID=A0ABV0YCC6_9TELE
MIPVWRNWAVSTNAIVHGRRFGDPSEVVPVLPPGAYTSTSMIIKQSLSSDKLKELQEGPGTRPPTGLFPQPTLLSTQREKSDLIFDVRVLGSSGRLPCS